MGSDTFRKAAVLLLALLGAARPAPAGSQSPAAPVGVGAHQLDARSVGLLRQLGVKHVRHTLYWSEWTAKPAYRQEFAAGVKRAADAGLQLLIVVHTPSGIPMPAARRPQVWQDFASFVAARAAQFPQVGAWQLWNEMDSPGWTDAFGSNAGLPMRERGRLYGRMLNVAYPAIKRANPAARVVTGGISTEPTSGFVDGILDVDGQFDALAIHAYGFPVRNAFAERGRAVRALLRTRGSTAPVWATEFGMEAAVIPADWKAPPREVDRHHLEAWRDPVQINDRERLYARVYGHVLTQDGAQSFDLVRPDGSLRPAAVWLRDYLR